MRADERAREAALGVLYAAWWLHRAHGEDSYARDLLLEWSGSSGLESFRRMARREAYQFRRGFWSEARRHVEQRAAAITRRPRK